MAEQGGLIGYGPRISDTFRTLGRQLAKILRNPGDIPIEQPSNFELASICDPQKKSALRFRRTSSCDKLIE
jgi:hypothetical protein